MSFVTCQIIDDHFFIIRLNRPEKHNAFHPDLIQALHQGVLEACASPNIVAILIQAEGKHFSAGADLEWMQTSIQHTRDENIADALTLGNMLYTLYTSPKPTIALVHGAAYGGGAGLVAACDFAIASEDARFCFPETKLGLIPAIISPYVIESIGAKQAKKLFLTGATIDAAEAHTLGLLDRLVPAGRLLEEGRLFAQQFLHNAPKAMDMCKKLVDTVTHTIFSQTLVAEMATWIAEVRTSPEAQIRLKAFLDKK